MNNTNKNPIITKDNVKEFLEQTKTSVIKTIDQNDDGVLNIEDVTVITEAVSNVAKNTAQAVKTSIEEQRRELEKKTLQPIFLDDLDSTNFVILKLIRVTEIDKKRAESEVCQGSIGHYTNYKDLKIVNIYRDNVDLFGLELYPDNEGEIYYVDPTDRGRYIAMEKYFNYLKIQRINELKEIVQDLGAKYFKVIYCEKEASYSSKNFSQQIKGKAEQLKGDLNMKQTVTSNSNSNMHVEAENEFEGHEPIEPTLRYLQRDLNVQSLIKMRFNKNSNMKREHYVLEFSDTVGIKESDAIKIDGALKSMKITSNTSVTSEVRNESRKSFEYEVEF